MTKFIIMRTSQLLEDKPCEEAEKELLLTHVDKRVAKGALPAWSIQINDLEHLLALKKKYGELIISTSVFEEIPFLIEIYDTHRE